jgi:hypothetical protein
VSGLPLGHPNRPLTDKQCRILRYVIDVIDDGPVGSREIAQALGIRDVSMALWSLRFTGVLKFERRNGNLLVTEVTNLEHDPRF